MDLSDISKQVETIKNMKKNGVFNNYIDYIVFPFYKNVVPNTRINFSFPLTILIGKNGSGKSSTLHALFGAPNGHTCSDFWFSTDLDPIIESGGNGPNRYFYGYTESKNSEIKEVMMSRIKRSETDSKKEDIDYWETCRPKTSDGMMKNERSSPVKKEVVYIDFRAEVSAFDKIFYFSKDNLDQRKELLRKRSIYLKRLFNNTAMRFKGCSDDKMGKLFILSEQNIKIINQILGKEYTEIKIADHKLFKNSGTSIYLKTNNNNGYSEANAGSGEIAVIQLVRKIEKAPDYSLILLDEPEVSLHPGAQYKLKQYLLDSIIKKKLQIIISSHSSSLIEDIPDEGIKLFKSDLNGKFNVLENISYKEAFFDIEDKVSDKIIIYCEDYAAQTLINKTLKSMSKEEYFSVSYIHGGEKTLVKNFVPVISRDTTLSKKVFLFLDGDMDKDYIFNKDELTLTQIQDSKYLSQCVEKAYLTEIKATPDGGITGSRDDQKCSDYLCYLDYFNNNVKFFPNKMIPEEIILTSKYAKSQYKNIIDKYDINSLNAKDVVKEISIFDHGEDNHINDTISSLSYKWSQEDSELKNKLIKNLSDLFNGT